MDVRVSILFVLNSAGAGSERTDLEVCQHATVLGRDNASTVYSKPVCKTIACTHV